MKRRIAILILACFFVMVFVFSGLSQGFWEEFGKGLLGELKEFKEFEGLFNLFLKPESNFIVEHITYYLDDPSQGKFKIAIIGSLPKKKGKHEYMLFLSSSKETIIEKVDISHYAGIKPGPKIEAEIKTTKTVEGSPVVFAAVHFLENGEPVEVEVMLQVQDANSLSIKNFSRVIAIKSATIYLLQGYAIADCNYPITISNCGNRLNISNPSGKQIELNIGIVKVSYKFFGSLQYHFYAIALIFLPVTLVLCIRKIIFIIKRRKGIPIGV